MQKLVNLKTMIVKTQWFNCCHDINKSISKFVKVYFAFLFLNITMTVYMYR